MARVRQLMLGLASGSALYSGMAPALGLGDITLHSALNQPLEAEIELLEVGDLGAQDVRVGLAPAEVFSRSGVERLYFLNDLRFTPLLRGSRSVIRVVSSRPVREPYLNFIVEVARPNGQLLREYTVLLDPPGSSAYSSVAASTAAPVAQAPRQAAPASSIRSVTPPAAVAGHRHQVVRGDSLWSIAARLREEGSGLSQQALMEGILALNPGAFIGGDPGLLQAGADLLLPDAARAAAASAPTAPVAERAAEPVAESSLSAEGPVSAPLTALEPTPEQADSLQLLAEKQRQVDLELASQAAENLQLQQGLAELQLQVQQLQDQLAAKDAQLAELAAERTPQAPVVQPAAEVPAEPMAPVTETGGWFSTLLAGGAGLLLLLGALFWAARRREKASPVVQVAAKAQPVARPRVVEAAPVAAVAPAARVTPAPVVQRPQAPTDPLEAANVYIAYGRLSEARGELNKALLQEPQRSDLRFRLLEVLAQQGDGQAFAREEAVLRAEGFDEARLDALQARHPNLRMAQPEPSEPVVQAAAPAPDEPLTEPDFQLNLDDLSLDADWDLVSPFSTTVQAKPKAAAEPELDASFSSNLQELPEVFELPHEDEQLSAFGEMEMVLLDDEEQLDDNFLDAFAGDADATAALQGDFDHLAGNPAHMAKLNQALAYIKQGDVATACDILNEVIDQGDDEQKRAARQLLAEIA